MGQSGYGMGVDGGWKERVGKWVRDRLERMADTNRNGDENNIELLSIPIPSFQKHLIKIISWTFFIPNASRYRRGVRTDPRELNVGPWGMFICAR